MGPPGHETPKGQGGVPRWNGRAKRLSAGSPAPTCGAHGSGREVTLSLTGKKTDRAPSVGRQPSLCAVVQSAAAGTRVAQQNRGGGPFCVRYWSCRLLSIRPAVSRVSNHAAGMNIDDACTEKGMCSVAYSSTTHRPYTDEHTTQLYQISYHHRGAEQA